MEYPPLVAGHTALFAVHLTTLGDFKPVDAGQARVEFTPAAGGQPTTLIGPQPSRPGAFRVEGVVPAAGRYRWAMVLDAPGLSDRHDLGDVSIFPDEQAARAAAGTSPPEDASAIAYLKEQQWTNEFATALVQEAELRASVRVPAKLDPLPGGEAVVAAPAAGRLMAEQLPSIGDQVRAGATMARLEPRLTGSIDRATLIGEVAEAESALEGARVEQARAERLLADRAVPARRVEDARRAATVAEARLKAAEARLTQRDETLRSGGGASAGNAFVLRAPIAGRITEVMATIGASYDEGALLFKITRTDALELKVFVPAAQTAAVRGLTGVTLEIPGRPDPIPLRFHHVHDPGVLDPTTRALPVQMEVAESRWPVADRPDRYRCSPYRWTGAHAGGAERGGAHGSGAAVRIRARRGRTLCAPLVEIAARDGDLVGIKSGVKTGERVVTRGAYDVQLASAARGLPAEGHVH